MATLILIYYFTADHLLHVACEHNHPSVVDYLLSNCHINPNAKNNREQSPLTLAKSKKVMKLLIQNGADSEDVYNHHRKILGNVFSKDPLRSPVKMFVFGHSGEGKSTLIEAMEHEPTFQLFNISVLSGRLVFTGTHHKVLRY